MAEDKEKDTAWKPGEMLPADQAEPQKKAEEANSDSAFNKGNAVDQNSVMTREEHPGVPSILSQVKNLVDACATDQPKIDASDDKYLLNEIANHIMLTTNDVVFHEKIKAALEARGYHVEQGPSPSGKL